MNCPTFYPSGTAECQKLRGKYAGFLILFKGNSVAAATAAALAGWKTLLAGKSAGVQAFYVDAGNGYANNTGDPERSTAAVGGTTKTYDPPPELVAFMDSSYCDYVNMYNADNKNFLIIPVLPNGNLEVKQKTDGSFAGCEAKLSIRRNLSRPDALQESYPVYIDYRNAADLDNVGVLVTDFDLDDLAGSVPVGLSMRIVTAYTAGVVLVEVVKRCTSEPKIDLTAAANYEILSQALGSSDTDLAITPADGGVGRYNLTIKKDSSTTPADITAAVTIRGILDDGTDYTYLTQPLTVTP